MLKIEKLNQHDYRSKFDCSVAGLNHYLKNIARQHLNKGISRTFVLIDIATPAEILGFFTLASNEDAKAYYEQFGFIPLPDDSSTLFLPLATLRQAYDAILQD